jgi:hypothetical protein
VPLRRGAISGMIRADCLCLSIHGAFARNFARQISLMKNQIDSEKSTFGCFSLMLRQQEAEVKG